MTEQSVTNSMTLARVHGRAQQFPEYLFRHGGSRCGRVLVVHDTRQACDLDRHDLHLPLAARERSPG